MLNITIVITTYSHSHHSATVALLSARVVNVLNATQISRPLPVMLENIRFCQYLQ